MDSDNVHYPSSKKEKAEAERTHRFFILLKKRKRTHVRQNGWKTGAFKRGFTLAFVLLHELTPAPKLYFSLKQSFFCVLTDVFLYTCFSLVFEHVATFTLLGYIPAE